MANYITVKDLAAELGIDSSNCRKFVQRMGLETIRVRPPGARGTAMLALTPGDAEKVRLERISKGFVVSERSAQSILTNDGPGAFYIVILDPEARPNRLKFGYTQNVDGRLAEHRTAAPEATLLGSWPAKRNWEPCIMAALSVGTSQVGPEVFDVESVAAVLNKAARFMEMLP